jgi:hypothetical protein
MAQKNSWTKSFLWKGMCVASCSAWLYGNLTPINCANLVTKSLQSKPSLIKKIVQSLVLNSIFENLKISWEK